QYAGVENVFGSWAAPSPGHHAFANLRQRNHYATLVNIGLASLAWLLPRANARGARWLAVGAALFLCTGLAASGSRTGMAELAVLLALAIMWQRRAATRVALVLVGAYAVAGVAL